MWKCRKDLKKRFGLTKECQIAFPVTISSVKVARIVCGRVWRCDRCFPHGIETPNSFYGKNFRSWKH